MLAVPAQDVFQFSQRTIHSQFSTPVPRIEQQITYLAPELVAYVDEVPVKFESRAHHQLSSSGRGGSAHIGNKIRDCEISFVPDSGNDRNRTRGNCAHYE